MPPQTSPIKYRISLLEAGWMLGFAFFLWGLMVLLSLTGLGEAGSEFIAFTGSMLFAAWFWLRGAYQNKAALQNLLVTLGGTVVDMIPFINDMPIMIIEVAAVIIATRREDRVIAKQNAAKAAAHAAQLASARANSQQAAAIAAANADAMRQQAMAASVAAANDNQRQEQERATLAQAANDDEREQEEGLSEAA